MSLHFRNFCLFRAFTNVDWELEIKKKNKSQRKIFLTFTIPHLSKRV